MTEENDLEKEDVGLLPVTYILYLFLYSILFFYSFILTYFLFFTSILLILIFYFILLFLYSYIFFIFYIYPTYSYILFISFTFFSSYKNKSPSSFAKRNNDSTQITQVQQNPFIQVRIIILRSKEKRKRQSFENKIELFFPPAKERKFLVCLLHFRA